MFLKEISIFIVFNFFAATAFDFNICKYGNHERNKSYGNKEIKHFCSRFVYEKLQQNARFGESDNDLTTKQPINNISYLNLELLQAQCKKKKFNSTECNKIKRYEILKEIENTKINFKNETDNTFFLDRLTFYDFSVFYMRPDVQEIQDFIQTMNNIKWDVRITDNHQFVNILWRLINIMNNCIVNKYDDVDTVLDILILHENVFTNIIHWKIFKTDDLYRYFFSVPSKIYIFGNNNYNLKQRVIRFVNSITSIIETHVLWNNEIEKYNFFTYVYFAKSLTPEDQVKTKGIKIIRKDDVLPNNITFNIENVEVIMKYQDGVNINGVIDRLKEVYDNFYQTFGKYVDLTLKKKIITHVFKNKDEYGYYGGLFGFATNNGGVTYHGSVTNNMPMIYYYGETNKIRNLGHEFVHGLINCYFPLSTKFNALIHEGVAEAIGQKESNIDAHVINNLFDNIKIDIDTIRDVDYGSKLSPYDFGFITMRFLIENGLVGQLTNILLKNDTCENFTNLVMKNLRLIEYHARNYKSVVIKTNDDNLPYEKLLDVYRSQKFNGDITIVIDNTFFELKKDYLFMHHNMSSDNNYINILTDKKHADIKYFVEFSIKMSLKNIYNYEFFYPEIENTKENITIFKNNILVKEEGKKEIVFNNLFKLGNEFNLNPIKKISNITFSSIKKYINNARKVFYNNYQHLSIPNKDANSAEQEVIYMLNTSPLIDMNKVRKINTRKALDTKRRTIVGIFENFFKRFYFFDRHIDSILRNNGEYYLTLNEPVTLNMALNMNTDHGFNKPNIIPTIKRTNPNTIVVPNNLENSIQSLIKNLNFDINNKYKLLENNIYFLKRELFTEIRNSTSDLISLIMNIKNRQEYIIKMLNTKPKH